MLIWLKEAPVFGVDDDEIVTDFIDQGRVVRKPVSANSGLKVNRGNNFPSIKMLSTAYALCSLRLIILKN